MQDLLCGAQNASKTRTSVLWTLRSLYLPDAMQAAKTAALPAVIKKDRIQKNVTGCIRSERNQCRKAVFLIPKTSNQPEELRDLPRKM